MDSKQGNATRLKLMETARELFIAKGVDRVDPANDKIPNSKPHIHFGDNEAALNNDGTWHDTHNKIPNINNKIGKWILDNGWKLPK